MTLLADAKLELSKRIKDGRWSGVAKVVLGTGALALGGYLVLGQLTGNGGGTAPTDFLIGVGVGDVAAARAAVDADASVVRESDFDGNTGLHLAASVGSAEIVELLAAKGADPNALNARGYPPLVAAINAPRERQRIVATLVKAGARASQKLPDGRNVLHVAAGIGPADPQVVALLAKDPAASSAVDAKGRTPRQVAEARGNAAITQLFR